MLLLLVRHAHTDAVGRRLAGRAAGHGLSDIGRSDAARLAEWLPERLGDRRLDAVYASPLERARETADAIARAASLAVEVLEAVTEIDYGEWTGRSFDELSADPCWREWNERRGTARVPGGETMREVQARAVHGLEELSLRHPNGAVAVVTHSDVVKTALATWLGMPLDLLHRLEIEPASTSGVALESGGARVLWVNDVLRGERSG